MRTDINFLVLKEQVADWLEGQALQGNDSLDRKEVLEAFPDMPTQAITKVLRGLPQEKFCVQGDDVFVL